MPKKLILIENTINVFVSVNISKNFIVKSDTMKNMKEIEIFTVFLAFA